jgi:hypothetical protein
MKTFVKISLAAAFAFVCLIDLFFPELSGTDFLVIAGSSITYAFALGTTVGVSIDGIPRGILEIVRRWHGNISSQFAAIDNLLLVLQKNKAAWDVPEEMLTELTGRRAQLDKLIGLCKSGLASSVDREQRDVVLKATVGYCLLHVKIWAYHEFEGNVLSADNVHSLGFLLPGENGGYHARKEPTKATVAIKVYITQMDNICVIIDHAYKENAALIMHGWPTGVRNALIVIYASDGKTEIYRQMTTHLHTYIKLPQNTRGKQFVIAAAFLQHVDDLPKFGEIQPIFSMPLTTNDLLAALDQQHKEDLEARMQEVDRHREDVERLQAQLDAAKKD